VASTITVNVAYDQTPVERVLGYDDYLVIAYCPIMSAFFGPGGAGNIPSTAKLGGLWYRQCQNTSTDIFQFNNFW